MEHLGVPRDAFRGVAKGGEPAHFCRAYGMPLSAHMGIKKYGERDACMLACYWCAKMAFLYNVWVENGADQKFRFTAAMVSTYEEPARVQTWASDSSTSQDTVQRLQKMRQISFVKA